MVTGQKRKTNRINADYLQNNFKLENEHLYNYLTWVAENQFRIGGLGPCRPCVETHLVTDHPFEAMSRLRWEAR